MGLHPSWGYYTAQSFHPGGINGLRCDGSVSFITDTIDNGNGNNNNDPVFPQGVPSYGSYANGAANMDSFGPSPFGVWGALGTPGGGETKSL